MQETLGKTTFFEDTTEYTIMALMKRSKFGNYLYLPYGPYLKNPSAGQACYEALTKLAQEQKAIFVRIEPQDVTAAKYLLERPNCQKSKDLNPAHTWVLDLEADRAELLTGFAQGTRTRYNQFPKKGLEVEVSKNPDDIKYLVQLQHALAHTKGIGTFSEKYLRAELEQDFAKLYLVYYNPELAQKPLPEAPTERQVVAASLFFDNDDTRYYMQSASDLKLRKLPSTVALLATAIFDAKEQGLKHFDFWGIAPDGAGQDHPWAGFTEFKKSFGGRAVTYAGTHDLIMQPAKYRLYQLARKGNRALRKLLH